MKAHPPAIEPLPPRLNMDEYADFVEETVRRGDPEHMTRQKQIEERILRSFRMPDDIAPILAKR